MSRPPRKRRKPLAPDALDFLKGYKNALAQVNRADVSSLRVLSDRPRGTPTKQSASLLYREEPRFHYLRCFLVWLYGHWSSSLANQTSGLTWHHPKCMLADVQDLNGQSDLPRLATPEARRLGDFRKLHSVRIQGGEIRGEWPATTDDEGYWNPFDAYYRNQTQPYMALAQCGTDDLSATRFHESYGPIGEDLSSHASKGSFRLTEFKVETWRFRFALALRGSLHKSELLRNVLLKGLDDAWKAVENIEQQQRAAEPGQRPAALPRFQDSAAHWRRVILDLRNAAGLLPLNHASDETVSYRGIREHFESLSAERLVSTARCYLSAEFWKKSERARFRLDFPDGEVPRLIVECPDLLTAFYWMLAKDWDADRAPRVCANCREFFPSKRKRATYCDKATCKEEGRRRLDWDRNKVKYNRNRKRARRKRRQETAARYAAGRRRKRV